MPTLLDLANGAQFTDYASPIDGQSLVPALYGKQDELNDIVFAEFAADGSTGPSRMVKRGSFKFMDIEGVDYLLFDLSTDPNELNNLIDNPQYAAEASSLRAICESVWDRQTMYNTITSEQKKRLKIHKITGGEPSYVNVVRTDDASRYIRNAGAAETKARARLPYVPPHNKE